MIAALLVLVVGVAMAGLATGSRRDDGREQGGEAASAEGESGEELESELERELEGEEGEEGEMPENALREIAKEGIEAHAAAFLDPDAEGEGGEASRSGPLTPAAERVEDLAYPRGYVDDQRAQQTERAFARVPAAPQAGSFESGAAFRAAARADHRWKELGPFTPRVTGLASQFVDPETLKGPSTQESGRVTALAIDPGCRPGRCRLWVAAAGGGIWRTTDALAPKPTWIAPDDSLPTTAFGSLLYDADHDLLYAGSGEPNGSGDSEAGLGLFRSEDGGAHWTRLRGSVKAATNRSIGAIAVDPRRPRTIYIGTDVARHGSASVNGGRRTPPNAPTLGVYRSTDGGRTFSLEEDLSGRTPANPTPPGAGTGSDWFQGGVNRLELDPNDPDMLYAGVQGYGVWRADQSRPVPTWSQVFHTMNQTNFNSGAGDFFGDRTEFDLVDLANGRTRAYVGDASDDWAIDGDDATPAPQAWRNDDVAAVQGSRSGNLDNEANGWIELSNSEPGTNGFAVYNYCQNGQCGYDSLVAHPDGASPGTVWYLGSMNYDELPAYDQFGTGAPPRSNGRALVRSTNAGLSTVDDVTWQDMTAVLESPVQDWGVREGIHPDLHAAVFARRGDIAFIGSDGGVVRIDTSTTRDQSSSCAQRRYNYDSEQPEAAPTPLLPDDRFTCRELLSGVPKSVKAINDGLRTIQFQSLSYNPLDPASEVMGGTQDNGTWSFDSDRTTSRRWFESVGGDGGQSGFNAKRGRVRFHNYFDATPEVNFHGDNPRTWLATYDPLQISGQNRSFYTPFTADPVVRNRVFTGLESVWRSNHNGGKERFLRRNGCRAQDLDPFRTKPCGDWVKIGQKLTGEAFGTSKPGEFVVATERAPSDTGTMWAATRTGRVFVSKNIGARPRRVEFDRIDHRSDPGRFVSGISIDPTDPNHAFVSYSGYNAYTPRTPGHVFEVTYHPKRHRATFTNRSSNLGDQPVTGIAYDQASGTVFVATDFGVLERPRGSRTWTRAGSGMPKVATYALTISHEGRRLYAATHGRGAYVLTLPRG